MKQKVVITGGAGFIGSHLAEYWASNSSEVVILDNLRTGNLTNIKHIDAGNFIDGDIRDKDLVLKILKNADYVFNLAALISVPESVEKPFECVDINVNGLLNILEAAKIQKVKKVVHASSAAVYGDSPESPKKILMRPNPKSPYGITKLDGEYYLQSYYENFGIKTISLRFFNVFGQKQNPQSQYASAIPIFVEKALKNDDIIIFGDGKQTRDFVFVKDVIYACSLAVKKTNVTGVFNVGTGIATSINQIVKLVIKLTNSKSKIIYEAERPGDIKHSLSSIEETNAMLNYSPQFNLEEGLKQTIEYFIKMYKY
jgi:UDP-glucose 4-epimerase